MVCDLWNDAKNEPRCSPHHRQAQEPVESGVSLKSRWEVGLKRTHIVTLVGHCHTTIQLAS